MRTYPTAYLPPISYFCTLLRNYPDKDIVLPLRIEQHETYPKQTLRNRCEITGSNGKQILTVPVCRAALPTTDNELLCGAQETRHIKIAYQAPWQRQHWMALVSAYQHTPFFFYYQDLFKPFYEKRCDYLLQWNNQLLKVIFQLLDIPVKIELTTQWEKADDSVFCQAETDATTLGTFPPYWQIFSERNGFLHNLSIVDLLFNLGTEAKNYLYDYANKH